MRGKRFQCSHKLPMALLFVVATLTQVMFVNQRALAQPVVTNTQEINRLVDSLFVVASSGELKYRDQVEPAKEQLAKLGAGAVPRLISKLTTPDARERLTVIRILKKIGAPAVPLLSEALHTLRVPIQLKRICWALGDLGPEARDATDELTRACGHENWQVREYALRALGKILGSAPTDIALNVVSQLMADSVAQPRKSAVWAAGEFHDVSLLSNLILALADNYYGARFNAIASLIKITTDSGVAEGNFQRVMTQLGEFVVSDKTVAGDLACEALGEIGARMDFASDGHDAKLTEIVTILDGQLRSGRELRRGSAVRALGVCAPADGWSVLLSLRLTESSPYVIQAIDSAIARIESP